MATTDRRRLNGPQDSGSGSGNANWPGRRLGLPAQGSRSIARPGRRLAALAVDWALSSVISWAFFRYDAGATLVIFAISQIVLVTTLAGSVGHLLFGMRVVPLAGGWIGLWRPIVRTLLICVVIPAVVWDSDQRGMHDRAAGTVLVRR